MTIKEYLKTQKRKIAILLFDEQTCELQSYEFDKQDFKSIPIKLLDKIVMEVVVEDDLDEVWVY